MHIMVTATCSESREWQPGVRSSYRGDEHADDRQFLLSLAAWDEDVENGFLSVVGEVRTHALRRYRGPDRRGADHALVEQLEDIGRQLYDVERTVMLSAEHHGGCLCPDAMCLIQGRR